MTYRQEMGRLSRELGKLLVEGGLVPGVDLPAAVAGHAAVVTLLRAVHDDLVPPEWVGIKDLGQALVEQPSAIARPLIPCLSAPAASKAGERWGNVAEWATAAQHEWRQAAPTSRPSSQEVWSELADLACVAEAIGLLDEDLADSFAEAGRWHDAGNFRSSRPALLETAHRVRLLAAAGPMPAAADLKPALTGEILLVPASEALPQALERLSTLITSAGNLPPAQVELISRVVAEAATAAAKSIGNQTDSASPHETTHPVSVALREHAHRLSTVTGFSPHLAPLRLGSGKAAAQAQHIHHLLRNLQLRGTTLPPQIARSAAHQLSLITTELTNSVEKQVKSGLWLMCREGTGARRWTSSYGPNDGTRMLDALRHASEHGETLRHVLNRTPLDATPKPSPIPRKVLAGPLSQRGSPAPTLRPWLALHRQR